MPPEPCHSERSEESAVKAFGKSRTKSRSLAALGMTGVECFPRYPVLRFLNKSITSNPAPIVIALSATLNDGNS